MNTECFIDFIKRFKDHVKCTPENPILLLLDNHGSHRAYDVLKFCRENGIHLLSFPPHTSHRLQPLDVSVFGPFQNSRNILLAEWLKEHPGRTMTIHDMGPIFARALEVAATERNIKSGFKAAGIYPLDRQIFQDIDFMPSETTDRAHEPNLLDVADSIELPHNRSQQSIAEEDIAEEDIVDDNDNSNDRSMDLDQTLPALARTSTPTSSVSDLTQYLEEIQPFPKAPPRKPAGNRKQQKSAILTDDVHFQEVEETSAQKEAKKAAAENRKSKTLARKKAAEEKKVTAAAKKLAKEMVAKQKTTKQTAKRTSEPSRVSKRRKTVASYIESGSEIDSE